MRLRQYTACVFSRKSPAWGVSRDYVQRDGIDRRILGRVLRAAGVRYMRAVLMHKRACETVALFGKIARMDR